MHVRGQTLAPPSGAPDDELTFWSSVQNSTANAVGGADVTLVTLDLKFNKRQNVLITAQLPDEQ